MAIKHAQACALGTPATPGWLSPGKDLTTPNPNVIGFTELDDPETIVASEVALTDNVGRLLALDLGANRVGVAVSDELRITVNPLRAIERRSWKDLLHRVANVIETYDARGLVIGLPLSLDGAEGSAAKDARAIAEKFRLSLSVPVYLQDERLTTFAAKAQLQAAGRTDREIKRQIDSEAATIILGEFIANNRITTE